ncbi:hypothetical protein CI610_00544 [invertebrate metagenome]|uniref:Uncharacterized protein n=1 Tax=invertebrate metagenome TaxID=1711999 RepID=A0A2H9TB42_9ZZZZ
MLIINTPPFSRFILVAAFILSACSYLPQGQTNDKKIIEQVNRIFTVLEQPKQDSIQTVNEQAEKLWIRRPGEERGERKDLPISHEQQQTINEALTELGLIKEIYPQAEKYDAVLVLGCRAHGMLNRLDFALKLKEKNISLGQLFILAGERQLGDMDRLSTLKIPNAFETMPRKTEIDIARIFLAMKNSQLKGLNASVTKTPAPQGRSRPDTEDTVRQWLADNKDRKETNLLVISNQPNIPYQDVVVKKILQPLGYSIETVGPAIDHDLSMFDRLNALHMWLKFGPASLSPDSHP